MPEKFKSVDEYMGSLPEETRPVAEEIRQTIKQALPDADEVISYNIPTFKVDGRYVVYFAGYKGHVSLYPFPDDTSLEKEIAPYRAGKGTLRFPIQDPLPVELIVRVVKALRERRP
ncbi:DUF1801 domain-containing protein [soil metagenome]